MDIYKELDCLNPGQREAVMHKEGPCWSLQVPVQVRTRVITVRTAYLINRGVSQSPILAVILTNKTTREMREGVRTWYRAGQGVTLIY